MHSFYKIFLFIATVFSFLEFTPSSVNAANSVVYGGGVIINPSASQTACSDQSVCPTLPGGAGECWNDASPGQTDCHGVACKLSTGTSFGSSWTKYRYVGCKQTSLDEEEELETCKPAFSSTTDIIYSTADKCITGQTGLRAGQCDGGYSTNITKYCCDATGQPEACIDAPIQDGQSPHEGTCPGGYLVDQHYPRVRSESCTPVVDEPTCTDRTKNGDETGIDCGGSCAACPVSCGAPCTYSQDGACYSGNCPFGAANCGFNNNCSYIGGCSSGTQVSCPADPPSSYCNVHMSFSNGTPNANSFDTVSVIGNDSNIGWNNFVYRVDDGSWVNSGITMIPVIPPNFGFSVPTGSPGNHYVQFAVNNGSVVCGGTGAFATQAVAPDCNANALEMSVSANPMNVGTGVTFYLSNTDGYQGSTHVEDYWNPNGGVNCSGGFWGSKTCTAIAGGNFTWTHKWKNIVPGNPNITSPLCEKTLNFAVNTPDTQRPTCNTFTISRTSGVMGRDNPTFSVSADDNVQVRTVDIKHAGTSSIVSSNTNGTNVNPYSLTNIPLNTTNLSPGLYTFNVLVTDTSGNINNIENMNSCTVTYRNDPPPWYPASCDANQVFSGCKVQGGNDCSDWGDPTKPTWQQCQTACSLPVSQRNDYCDPRISQGSITCPRSVAKTGNNWQTVNLTTSSSNTGTGTKVFVHNSTCNIGTCDPASGWTEIPNCATNTDVQSKSCSYAPPADIQPNTSRTFALFNQNRTQILSTCDTRFEPNCTEGDTRAKSCTGVATVANACTL